MMLMVWLIFCLQCSSLLVLLIPGRNLWWCWCCWFFDGKFACGAHSWSVWFLEEKYDNDDDDDDDDALVELLLVLFFTPGHSYSWRKNQRFKGSWSWLPPPEISKVHTIIMCWEMHCAEVGRVSAQLRNTLCSALLCSAWLLFETELQSCGVLELFTKELWAYQRQIQARQLYSGLWKQRAWALC